MEVKLSSRNRLVVRKICINLVVRTRSSWLWMCDELGTIKYERYRQRVSHDWIGRPYLIEEVCWERVG